MKTVHCFGDLVGCELSRVTVNRGERSDVVMLRLVDGRVFTMYHSQDCCESVRIEDIDGELDEDVLVDMVGLVLFAEETTAEGNRRSSTGPVPEDADDCWQWTFYRIGTIKGTVVMRWLGSSNGYYSMSVDFAEVTD